MDDRQELAETIRGLLVFGPYRMDDPDTPFSGMAGIIADVLWGKGYRQEGSGPSGPKEYTLIRETDAVEEVLVPPHWGSGLEAVFEYLDRNGGMKPGMTILYRHAEMWDELDPYWWEDQFEDYQKERGSRA